MALSKQRIKTYPSAEGRKNNGIWELVVTQSDDGNGGREEVFNWATHPWALDFGPPKMNVSLASTPTTFQEITGYRGPRPDQNRYNDFRHFFEIFGDNGDFVKDTVIDGLQQIDNVLTTQIFKWMVTNRIEWSYRISTTQKTLAEHSGPQTQTRGIATSERTISVKLLEWRQEYEEDTQYFLTPKGKKSQVQKSRELIASFLRRMNRLIIGILTNHADIRRAYQDDFNLKVNLPLGELIARRWSRALPIQKGGMPYLTQDYVERRKLIRDLGPEGSDPNWMIVGNGTVTTLGTLPEESIFILVGNDRMKDAMERGDDAKKVLWDKKVKIHEYVEDGIVDPDAANPYIGTLRRRASYNGMITFSPKDAGIELSKYSSHKRGGAVLNMRTNDVMTINLSMLIENSRMFDKNTGKLDQRFWNLKARFNDHKLNIQEAFKRTSLMMFPNQDIAMNEGKNLSYWDVAQWVGEAVKDENMCHMVRTILNDKGFNRGLLNDLNDAIALSKELSSGEFAPEQLAIWLAAVNQAGFDANTLVANGNRFGSIDLPLFSETERGYVVYYTSPKDKKTYTINNRMEPVEWNTTTISDTFLFIKKELVTPKGWGTVGGIATIAELRTQAVGSIGRRFINDELIARAQRATRSFDIFTKLFEKFFPNHICLRQASSPTFIRAKESKYTKIASVCQNFLCIPAWSFYVKRRYLSNTIVIQSDGGGDEDVSGSTTEVGSSASSFDEIKKFLAGKINGAPYMAGLSPAAVQNDRNWRQFLTLFSASSIGKQLFGGSWSEYMRFMRDGGNGAQKQKRVVLGMSKTFHNFIESHFAKLDDNTPVEDLKKIMKTQADSYGVDVKDELRKDILGARPNHQPRSTTRDDVLINSRLFMDLSSFSNSVHIGNYFEVVIPRNPKTRAPYASREELEAEDNTELDASSIETLFFMHDNAKSPAKAGMAATNTSATPLGSYISTYLANNVAAAITRSNLSSDIEYGLLVALATCSNEMEVWKSWDIHNIYMPATFDFVRPSRCYEVETSILLDSNELGYTYVNGDYSNLVIGTAATERWYKVSAILLGVPSIEQPFNVARNDDFWCKGYICGEDETFFDDTHPFVGTKVIQSASNMVFMMPPEIETPDFTPLSGVWSPATFSEETSNHFGIEFNKPTRGSVPFYDMLYGFNSTKLPPPKLLNVVAGFNKDDNFSLDQILTRMWCGKYSPATERYTDVGPITDVFGQEGSYPFCKTERTGGLFKKQPNITIAPRSAAPVY